MVGTPLAVTFKTEANIPFSFIWTGVSLYMGTDLPSLLYVLGGDGVSLKPENKVYKEREVYNKSKYCYNTKFMQKKNKGG